VAHEHCVSLELVDASSRRMVGAMSISEEKVSKTEEVWPLWKLGLIALPQMGVMVLWIFLGPNTTPYLKSLGASEAFATLNNSAGPVVGFFVGPIVGTWSDQSTSKWGRRRPIIVAGLLSTLVAGLLYSGAAQITGEKAALEEASAKGEDLPPTNAMYLAAIMQWVLDFTINAMQTPFRALVADLASTEQQLPTQIFFAIVCSVGVFLAFTIMKIYDIAIHHMLELMSIVMLINFACVGVCLLVAKEKQFVPQAKKTKSACGPLSGMCGACVGMPASFYILLFVQAMAWLGNTVWGNYGQEWFTHSVYPGDAEAIQGSDAQLAYIRGAHDFGTAGQYGSFVNLACALLFMAIGMFAPGVPAHLMYAPCLFIGTFVCFMCSFLVGNNAQLAILAFVLSNVCLTAAGCLPYGMVARWNKEAELAGKVGSVAMQMAVLNCCITVGQQLTTMILAGFETGFGLASALKYLFVLSMIANGMAAVASLFLGVGKATSTPTETAVEP